MMSHDLEQARSFLTLLDETTDEFTFQTFDDKSSKNPVLAKWLHGTIDEHFSTLVNYNKAGAGVFVMVQNGNGSGRNIKAVDRIRCVFNENDHGITKEHPLEANIIVQSSPGKYHYYFLCDGLSIDEFKPIQARLINDYGSDPNASDLARVMRLPGFFHNKKEPHLVSITHESGAQPYSREILIKNFPPYIKSKEKLTEDKVNFDTDLLKNLRSALLSMHSDSYDLWIKCGLALKQIGDKGRGLWLEWSSTSDKFDAVDAVKKWESFKPDNIDFSFIFNEALRQGNWLGKTEYEQRDKSLLSWIDGHKAAQTATATKYLINKILETDSHGILAGSSGAYKSFLAIKLMHSICTGKDFFGYKVFNTGKVLYVCGEGFGGVSRRTKALEIVEGDFPELSFMRLENMIRIDNSIDMANLRILIEREKPTLVVFDTFGSLVSAVNENDNGEVGRVLRLIKETCRVGDTSSLIVHHYGKDVDRGMRGAIAFKANTDFELSMSREKNSNNVVFSCLKMKDGDYFDDIFMTAHIVDIGLKNQDGSNSTSIILKKNIGVNPKESTALSVLRKICIEDGIDGKNGIVYIQFEKWRESVLKEFKNSNSRRDFIKASESLIEKELVFLLEINNEKFCYC